MPKLTEPGPATVVERVKVHSSPNDHWAAVDGYLTLCGRTALYPVKYRAKKPMCRRCSIEAARLAVTVPR